MRKVRWIAVLSVLVLVVGCQPKDGNAQKEAQAPVASKQKVNPTVGQDGNVEVRKMTKHMDSYEASTSGNWEAMFVPIDDPARAIDMLNADLKPTAEELDALRHAMGLDQPVWIQYGQWLMNALHGDLGVSYLTQKPVLDEILRRFPITFHLAVWAIGWVLVIGIPAGIWAAEKKDTAGEIVLRAGALFFISVPSFFLAILCMLLFSEEWRLLPSGGYGSMMQMIMPSFVLAAGTSAAVMRLQQTSMTEVAGKEFITTERAKGLPMPFIMKRHVLPNALVPVITMLGTFFGAILGGSVIIEELFSIPGLGSYVLAAIWGRDYPVIQGYVIVSGTVFLTFNYLVDILCGMLNPSVRKGGDL